MGTWHRVSAKHLPVYLDEMTWRFNSPKNPFLFRDTMLRLIHSENLEYRELIAAQFRRSAWVEHMTLFQVPCYLPEPVLREMILFPCTVWNLGQT